MHPRTRATLEDLEHANWFASVGIPDTESAVVLGTWAEAIASCSSAEWEELCLEAANQYRQRLAERSAERFELWNQIVNRLRPDVESLVDSKIQAVVVAHELPKVFGDTVKWDILHACMEAEYADVYESGFYASQAYWYVKGHFPCGWWGEFPEGTLVIY